jgi:hypothetical protein
MLALKLERSCESYADEDLEVVSESRDQCKEFLGHAHPTGACLLRM